MLLFRSIPFAAGASRRALAAVILRLAVSAAALATLTSALIDLRGTSHLDQSFAFAALAIAVAAIECAAIGRDGRSVAGARGVTFALLVTAQMTLGIGAAAWLGVIAAFAGTSIQRCGFRIGCERAALVVTLLAAGEWLAGPGVGWFPFLMGGCAAFFTVWLLRIRKRVSRWNLASGMLVRAWVVALATHNFWSVHGPFDRWVTELSPLAARVAGALLADLLVVLTLTIGIGALDTLDAWALSMPPVVLRVHLLALAAGALLLATITVGWRRRRPLERAHGPVEPVPPCQPGATPASSAAVHVAYCLTL